MATAHPASSAPPPGLLTRLLTAYARWVTRHPGRVLVIFAAILAASLWGTSRLTINANQLDLISDKLVEVQDVRRLIDMIGGTGHLILALKGDEEARLRATADDLAAMLEADREHVRQVTYKIPVAFFQEKMVLFVKTPDLLEGKRRIMAYLRQKLRQQNPFYVSLRDAAEPTLDLKDLQDKYSRVGKKTILDDYYISADRRMMLLLIKPRWDVNDLDKTRAFVAGVRRQLADYRGAFGPAGSAPTQLVEDEVQPGAGPRLTFGMTGSYITSLDDSYAIADSLEPVSLWAFVGIMLVTVCFFRLKIFPSIVVLTGVVAGSFMTFGFTYLTVGQLNMITSILGAILLGFGVDYGIHLVFRVRIELGAGKPAAAAVADAMVFAGRPAVVAAVVTGGSFMVLMVSQFKGFSQFGFLAGTGTMILGLSMFTWCGAWLALAGRVRADLPARLVGTLVFPAQSPGEGARIRRPAAALAACSAVVLAVCAFAVPWAPAADGVIPAHADFVTRLKNGVHFNYNSRAMMAEGQTSVRLQDEINRRFEISSDPVGVATADLAQTRELFDELTSHPEKYPSFDQVASIYSFVPPAAQAADNAAIMRAWRGELEAMGVSMDLLPAAWQPQRALVDKILHVEPFGVDEVPRVYREMFTSLPETAPENRGYLTFIYPGVDMMDGKKLLQFNQEADVITCASGNKYRAAGLAVLFGKLATIVLWDGKVTVVLAALWILLMHYLDFRSLPLALASVLPLGVGLVMMLGLMSLTQHDLNFMNIIMLPILLGFGVSHGLYLLHRFLEGVSPLVALRSVGAAVASSTLTAMAGFAALFRAHHLGLQSMGYVATLGLGTTLLVSFSVLAAVLQLMYDRRHPPAA